ncbi:MAG: hypothetical protein U0746_23150 [Gemmataceae bacterium]
MGRLGRSGVAFAVGPDTSDVAQAHARPAAGLVKGSRASVRQPDVEGSCDASTSG